MFTQQQADVLRRTTQGVHAQMRDLLTRITAQRPVQPVGDNPNAPLRVEVPPLTPWRHYLAHHKESQAMIGPGVRAFYSQFRSRNDRNRATGQGDQLRLDFVVERIDGSIATCHPGKKPANDAKVHYYEPGQFVP